MSNFPTRLKELHDEVANLAIISARYPEREWYAEASLKAATLSNYMFWYMRDKCESDEFEHAKREYEESVNRANALDLLHEK
jgi:hypothetical protein